MHIPTPHNPPRTKRGGAHSTEAVIDRISQPIPIARLASELGHLPGCSGHRGE